MSDVFLSSVVLNPRSFAGRTALADVHQMHRSVMALFGQVDSSAAREQLGVLYRVEDPNRILVQSSVEPDGAGLPDGFELAAFRIFDPGRFTAGSQVRYRLAANTTRQKFKQGGRGRRVAVVGDEAIEWWAVRAGRCGLDLRGHPEVSKASLVGRRRAGSRLTFCGHRFDGLATVVNHDRFAAAVRAGVGRGKSYGFGLLSAAVIG